MSGKKSTPKPKPKAKPKRKTKRDNHAEDYAFLNRRIDVIQQQTVNLTSDLTAHISKSGADYLYIRNMIDGIKDTLRHNQIYPEPENRWIPAVGGRGIEPKEQKPDKEPETWYTVQKRPENLTTYNTFAPREKRYPNSDRERRDQAWNDYLKSKKGL